jgi:glycosyltransferase involved in cell wall biosynthesis
MARRLLVVVPYFPPDGKAGGAEMFALALVEGLVIDHGWDVTIVTSQPRIPIAREVVSERVTVHRLPYQFRISNSPISLSWFWELKRIIASVDPDVINIHLPVPGLGDIASRVAGERPVVLYYHFGSMKKGDPALDPIIWAYESIVLPRCLKRAVNIACCSAYVKHDFLRKFSGKIVVIPPGVDIERFHPAANGVTEPRVLYVGSLNKSDKHKRFSDLLTACRILLDDIPDLRLDAVGGGDGREIYEDLAVRMGIAKSVDFHGRLEGEALAEAYRQAAVLAVPSLKETFGMVITEAMASGLPVVAVDGGGVPEVVDDARDGLLVPPRSPRELASAIGALLTDRPRAVALGQAGRRKAVEKWCWPHQVTAMNELLVAAAARREDDRRAASRNR